MKVTYYALTIMDLGDRVVEPGDLVPEAAMWRHRLSYLQANKIAPVLVSTLSKADQDFVNKTLAVVSK